jgi:hypothetical protein
MPIDAPHLLEAKVSDSVHDFLPSASELIPNLGVLDRSLLERTENAGRPFPLRSAEQPPFYLRGACESFNRLLHLREIAGEEFLRIESAPNSKWLIKADLADCMAFAVETCLMYLRRSVDAVIFYIGNFPKYLQLKSSLSDVAKLLAKGKCQDLDEGVSRLILEYWNSWGERVKGYRDQAAHYAIGVSDCVVFRHALTRGIGLRLLLPDDPFTKSPETMTYRPGVPTVGFLNGAIYETVKFVNETVERLIDLTHPNDQHARIMHGSVIGMRGSDTINFDERVAGGEPVPHSMDVRTVVERAVRAALREDPAD